MSPVQSISLAQDAEALRDTLATLAPCRYFQTMSPEVLGQVLREGDLLDAPTGTVLIREGETDDNFYVLLHGALQVRSGGREILRLSNAGDIIGEIAIISAAPRSADVLAAEPSRLVRIPFSGLNAAEQDPERVRQVFEVFSHIMAAKLNETSARAKRYEDAVRAVRQMESSQTRLESEIQDQLQEIALYSRVIEISQDAVLITDLHGVVQRCNPAAQRQFPALASGSAGDAGGRGERLETLAAAFERAELPLPAPQAFWEREWSRGPEDDPLVLHVSVVPIRHEEAITGLAFQCRDITLRKTQERALERMVAERTQEVRGLLDNMAEGILTIAADGTIYPGFSAETERLIGERPAGASLTERLGLDAAQRAATHDTFALLLQPGLQLDWDDLARLMPSEFQPAAGRWLRARYRPVRSGEGGPVERIMVMLNDITGEKALADDMQHAHWRQERIVRILQDRENFELFQADALRMLGEARDVLGGLAVAQRKAVDGLFRTLHTLKGSGALFGLREFSQAAHEGEDVLRYLREHRDTPIDDARRGELMDSLERLETLLRDASAEVRKLIGEEEGAGRSISLTDARLRDICAQALAGLAGLQGPAATCAADVRAALARLRRVPAPRLLHRYRGVVERIAQGLGKEVELIIEDPGACELEPAFFQQVDPVFLHLLRNAVDHGVEPPEERRQAGKAPAARIVLTAQPGDGTLTFSIADDGRGIDMAHILAVAVERGFVKPAEKAATLTPEQVTRLLFIPGFSSAGKVTDLSGRGVGLDVVKTEVERLGGRLQLDTVVGQGTTFRIVYPLPAAEGAAP